MSSRKQKRNIRFALLRKKLDQIRSKRYIFQQNTRAIATKTEPSDQGKIIRPIAQETFSVTKKLPTKKSVVFASWFIIVLKL
jgi:hypothetical protein